MREMYDCLLHKIQILKNYQLS